MGTPRWTFPRSLAKRQGAFLDVTVICPLADSYISAAARDAGAAAELAASRKEAKYACLIGRYIFAHIAFEKLGVPALQLASSLHTLAED